jgi:hypothetical protein
MVKIASMGLKDETHKGGRQAMTDRNMQDARRRKAKNIAIITRGRGISRYALVRHVSGDSYLVGLAEDGTIVKATDALMQREAEAFKSGRLAAGDFEFETEDVDWLTEQENASKLSEVPAREMVSKPLVAPTVRYTSARHYCITCGEPAYMAASLGPACAEHYDELSG